MGYSVPSTRLVALIEIDNVEKGYGAGTESNGR